MYENENINNILKELEEYHFDNDTFTNFYRIIGTVGRIHTHYAETTINNLFVNKFIKRPYYFKQYTDLEPNLSPKEKYISDLAFELFDYFPYDLCIYEYGLPGYMKNKNFNKNSNSSLEFLNNCKIWYDVYISCRYTFYHRPITNFKWEYCKYKEVESKSNINKEVEKTKENLTCEVQKLINDLNYKNFLSKNSEDEYKYTLYFIKELSKIYNNHKETIIKLKTEI